MRSSWRGGISGSWAGWIENGACRREVGNSAAIEEDAFGERWSPRRRFPEELEPLPRVVGSAVERAGWWHRGSSNACSGGAIVGADGGFVQPSVDFANHLRKGYSAHVSPTDFIHSLPSTAASLLTKLYGLADYQTTFVHGAASGWMALSHTLDLLNLGRIERAVVATLSVTNAPDGDGVAKLCVAICLGPTDQAREYEISVEQEADVSGPTKDDELTQLLKPFGPVAALPLTRLAQAVEHQDETFETSTTDGAKLIVTVEQ